MFLRSLPCRARSHMYRMSLVFPQPVSPMITTGMSHLRSNKRIHVVCIVSRTRAAKK